MSIRTALLRLLLCNAVMVVHASAQHREILPKGYRDVGPDRALALQELCRATAETGLFAGAVLVADEGEVIYKAGVWHGKPPVGYPQHHRY